MSQLLIAKAKIFTGEAVEKIKEFGSVYILETQMIFIFFQGWIKRNIKGEKKRKKKTFTITLEVIPNPDVSVIECFIKQKEVLICYFKSSRAGNSLI